MWLKILKCNIFLNMHSFNQIHIVYFIQKRKGVKERKEGGMK